MYWRILISSAPALLIISLTTNFITATSSEIPFACKHEIKAATLRVILLIIFHIAPYAWTLEIVRSLRATPTAAQLSMLLSAVKVPLTLWVALCLLLGWWLWSSLTC